MPVGEGLLVAQTDAKAKGGVGSLADVVDKATRSRMMGRIRGKNTTPELTVRRYLHSRGFRFRLHQPNLPGKPDLVFPRYRAVVFVHGCFWHRHEGCSYATTPATNRIFWLGKLEATVQRDRRQIECLKADGWRVFVIWECEVDERHLKKLAANLVDPDA